MISIDFCEKMSHANTRLDVFRRALVSTPAIFFPRKPEQPNWEAFCATVVNNECYIYDNI